MMPRPSSSTVALSLSLSLLTLTTLLPVAVANSEGYYCGADYNDALSCTTPCPSTYGFNANSNPNECTEDKPYCFGPGLTCLGSGDDDEDYYSYSPTMAPLDPADPINSMFCGLNLEYANVCSGTSVWCPSGGDDECPAGMSW